MNATAQAFAEYGLPQPKFRKGQVVYEATTVHSVGQHPCPDCLGSKQWKAITPAGAEIGIACERCGKTFTNRDLPSLQFQEWKASATRLTIGQVKLNDYSDHPVSYMAHETGIGSGRVYDESKLFATEEEALAAATLAANEVNAKNVAAPERLEKAHFSSLTFKDATLELARKASWDAWWAYRHLYEEVANLIDESALSEDDKEELKRQLKYEKKFKRAPAIGGLLAAARKAVNGDASDLAAALAAIPAIFMPSEEAEPVDTDAVL